MDKDNLLICLDISFDSIVNGSFSHILNSLRNISEYMEEDCNIGFVYFDKFVNFI